MSASTLPTSDELHPDEQQLAGYVAISRAAVGALLLGFASPLILISPLLIVVPLAGIVTAVVALRSIASSQGQLRGQWPATIGLCLATLFLGWGVTSQLSRQAILVEEAERFADAWLELVRQGKLQEADQYYNRPLERITSPEALAEHYTKDREAVQTLQGRFESEPLKSFRAIGPSGKYRFDSLASQARASQSDNVVLKYWFTASDNPARRNLWIRVGRNYDPRHGTAEWIVGRVEGRAPDE